MTGTTRESGTGRTTRQRPLRLTAAAVAVGVLASALVTTGGGTAQAATPLQAQAVGRFLDGSTGGVAIQTLADLKDARATSPGTMTLQNPFDVTLGGQGTVPLTGALQLPGGGVFTLGAANQVATASADGGSLGASGAIANSGGAQLSDSSGKYPSDATIDLSADLIGSVPIPGIDNLPGIPNTSTDLAALGSVKARIGAISALARTRSGGEVVTPNSSVGQLQLTIASPALGALLAQLKAVLDPDTLGTALSAVTGKLPVGVTLPDSFANDCTLTAASPTDPISLTGGAVVVDPTTAKVTVDVGLLIKKLLNKDISNLKSSNFDVTAFLVKSLPEILSTGLADTVDGIISELRDDFSGCLVAVKALADDDTLITSLPVGTTIGDVTSILTTNLTTARTALVTTISGIGGQFGAAAGDPLGQLVAALEKVVTIGLNVQHGPGIAPREKAYPFSSDLNATPDQATGVVAHQTLVRALEVDLLNTSGLPDPGLGSLPIPNAVKRNTPKAKFTPAAADDSTAVLAFGNAAVGPSTPSVATPTPTQEVAPIVAIPTAVPAGLAGHDGGSSPLLPIAVVLLALVAGTAGVTSLRTRGRHGRS